MSGLRERLRQLALGWGSVGLAYSAAALLQGPGATLRESALDRLVPFDTAGVWFYLSFFLLVPAAYLGCDAWRSDWLRRSMQYSALAGGVLFVLLPTTLAYPAAVGAGTSAAAWTLLAALDSGQNCFPSLHGALTLLCVAALLDGARPLRSALALAWGLAIAYAVVQTRRHLFLDLGAGLTLGLACGLLARRACPAGGPPAATEPRP